LVHLREPAYAGTALALRSSQRQAERWPGAQPGRFRIGIGIDAAAAFVRAAWAGRVEGLAEAPRHPKARLQEWTAANQRRPPAYRIVETSGPDHARRFTVEVEVKGVGGATGTGLSKQEAETAAAQALLEKLA